MGNLPERFQLLRYSTRRHSVHIPVWPFCGVCSRRNTCESLVDFYAFHAFKDYFSPSQSSWLLAHDDFIRLTADDHLSFILHTITGFHWLRHNHYYWFICHLTPTSPLDHSLTDVSRKKTGYDARLPRLLHRLPVRNSTLKHTVGLTEYRASRYFARLPTNTAVSGSLSLCTSNFLWLPSDPTVSQ